MDEKKTLNELIREDKTVQDLTEIIRTANPQAMFHIGKMRADRIEQIKKEFLEKYLADKKV